MKITVIIDMGNSKIVLKDVFKSISKPMKILPGYLKAINFYQRNIAVPYLI